MATMSASKERAYIDSVLGMGVDPVWGAMGLKKELVHIGHRFSLASFTGGSDNDGSGKNNKSALIDRT
jgi:hypothetical protein